MTQRILNSTEIVTSVEHVRGELYAKMIDVNSWDASMKQRTHFLVVLPLGLALLACELFTPACDPGQLSSTQPKYPGSDSVIAMLKPTYQWEYANPNCDPEGYLLVVSDKADLSEPKIYLRETNPVRMWTPDVELEDCTEYYWKVAAIAGDQDGPFSEVHNFRTDAEGICGPPPCAQVDSSEPILTAPESGSITSTTPELSWQFPPGCQPDSFVVQLSTWFDFLNPLLIREGNSTGMLWSPSSPLANATLYYWRVAASIDDTVGPFSDVDWFFTGPECTDETVLVAPDLIMPEDGTTFSKKQIYLQWHPGEPGCIPDGYYRDLQTVSDFSGLNLMVGIYNEPGTSTLTSGLQDCTRYFWRIAAIQDGERGPESLPRSFVIEISEDCPDQVFIQPSGLLVQNAFCRKGPDPIFDDVTAFVAGTELDLVGLNPGRTWGKFEATVNEITFQCWISLKAIEVTGEENAPILVPPPLPETQLPVCTQDLDPAACNEAGGTYVVGIAAPYCQCPE